MFLSIAFENCRCCLKHHSIKHYHEGKEAVEKRLDIVKLVKTSVDLDVLKKLLLQPRQRNLFKKQRRGAIKIDTSSSSAPDSDSDKDCLIFEAKNDKSIMNADLTNTTDRRLLLGIIHRDNDFEPRKMTNGSSGGGLGASLADGGLGNNLTNRVSSSIELL